MLGQRPAVAMAAKTASQPMLSVSGIPLVIGFFFFARPFGNECLIF